MATSIFEDKATKPTDQMLAEAVGKTYALWEEFKKHLNSEYGELMEEWKYYNPKSGWQLKTLKKKRNLFFFTPLKEHFIVVFVFGDKAVSVVENSDFPEYIINDLKNARKYAEGRSIHISVKTAEDIEHIKQLVKIKVNN